MENQKKSQSPFHRGHFPDKQARVEYNLNQKVTIPFEGKTKHKIGSTR